MAHEDIKTRLQDTIPDSASPLDVEHLRRRGRRRRLATRTAAGISALALVGVVAAATQLLPTRQVQIIPAGPGTAPGSSPAAAESGLGPSEPAHDATDGWTDLTVDQAVDRLVAVNRHAPARPVPEEGELLVDRTYGVWSSTTVEADGTVTHDLELAFHDKRTDVRGNTTVVREPIATLDNVIVDPARLREIAAGHLDGFDPEVVPGARVMRGAGSHAAGQMLAEAEAHSRGSAEPAPDATARPDQAAAFIEVADALRLGTGPEERIRALEIIDRLDPSLVSYRGLVNDLRGHEGVGITGIDGDVRNTLIFDPETGDLLGELTEVDDDAALDEPPITGYTSRETLIDNEPDS